jgi:hypothetical protein
VNRGGVTMEGDPLARVNVGRCFVGDGPPGRKARWAGHASLRAGAHVKHGEEPKNRVSFNIKDE